MLLGCICLLKPAHKDEHQPTAHAVSIAPLRPDRPGAHAVPEQGHSPTPLIINGAGWSICRMWGGMSLLGALLKISESPMECLVHSMKGLVEHATGHSVGGMATAARVVHAAYRFAVWLPRELYPRDVVAGVCPVSVWHLAAHRSSSSRCHTSSGERVHM